MTPRAWAYLAALAVPVAAAWVVLLSPIWMGIVR